MAGKVDFSEIAWELDMATIFISSLPFRADEAFIRNLFSPYGRVVSVDLHADWVNPTHEPYAYVDLETSDPKLAVDALDGKNLARTISVSMNGLSCRLRLSRPSDLALVPQLILSE